MSFGGLLGGVGDALNMGSGIFSMIDTIRNRKKLYAREDSAVQRRAKDLELAGLSKTLAAGSPAQTMGTQSPQGLDFKAQAPALSKIKDEKALLTMQTMKMKADIGVSESQKVKNLAEADFIADKKRDIDSQIGYRTSQVNYNISQIERNRVQNSLEKASTALKKHDFKILDKLGIHSGQRGLVTELIGLVNAIWGYGREEDSGIFKANQRIDSLGARAAELAKKLWNNRLTESGNKWLAELMAGVWQPPKQTGASPGQISEWQANDRNRNMMPYNQ